MKTTTILCFFALALIISTGSLSLAQTEVSANSEWTLIHEVDGISFYGKEQLCSNPTEKLPTNYAFIKIVNANDRNVNLNYAIGLQFEEGCSGCDFDSEFSTLISVPASSSIEGNCSLENPALQRIIRNNNLPGGWEFQSMKIVNLLID